MRAIYDDEVHVRARNHMRNTYNGTLKSFRYYMRQNTLTEDEVIEKFGDVYNNPDLMQRACDIMKKEKVLKRRRDRTVVLLQREVEKLEKEVKKLDAIGV